MEGKKGIFERIRETVRKPAVRAVLAISLALHTPYLSSRFYNKAFPSVQRENFQNRYGTEIQGWQSDVENGDKILVALERAVHWESIEKPFNANSIRVRSKSALKRNLADIAGDLLFAPISGYANPITGNIVLDDVYADVIHHEIKHIKTFELMSKDLQFRKKWEAVAVNHSEGRQYLSLPDFTFSRLRGLRAFVKPLTTADAKKLGFVSDYARTNFYEDVAETCSLATNSSWQTVQELILGEYANPIIIRKINLCQESGLSPRDYADFVKVMALYRETWEHRSLTLGRAGPFMAASEIFLKNNPSSIFEDEIRVARASLLKNAANSGKQLYEMSKKTNDSANYEWAKNVRIEDAINEYKRVLTSNIKVVPYLTALDSLETIYGFYLNDPKKKEIFGTAYSLYAKRMDSGRLSMEKNGVNDFLTANGVLQISVR